MLPRLQLLNCLWLLPFYPSPGRDDGYDIADYRQVNPDFGTLSDFRRFMHEAKRRKLRVITELVINHTSDQHPWFKEARSSPDSPKRDYYVWSDTPEKYKEARIIFLDTESSNWTWDEQAGQFFWHRFYECQPDLYYDSPAVQEEMLRVMQYWLDLGIDGFRADAVPYLFEREGTNCENLPETHEFLRELRAHMDAKYGDRMLLAEANQWPEDVREYFGDSDECHMAFHFPLMPRMFMALRLEDRKPLVEIVERTPAIPASCQWGLFLRNHDELTLEMVTDEERDYMYQAYAAELAQLVGVADRGIHRSADPVLRSVECRELQVGAAGEQRRDARRTPAAITLHPHFARIRARIGSTSRGLIDAFA